MHAGGAGGGVGAVPGRGSIPGQGTEIPHVTWYGQKT